MGDLTKGKSPFYPGQPVPVDLFVGRKNECKNILERGANQVANGKPATIFVQGEYGIGKSSFAAYVQALAEKEYGLHSIYASLGGCKNVNDLLVSVMEATVRSGAIDPTRSEKIREWLADYIGSPGIFGVNINLEAIKKDAPNLSTSHNILSFLGEIISRLKGDNIKGIFLVLDEINGIVSDDKFTSFIKGLVDTNALMKEPLPLLLMLCGVEEKRREMIKKHQPIDRVFDIIDIGTMKEEEMRTFFTNAYSSVQISIEEDALNILTRYSAGFPKIMHIIGDCGYWIDKDGILTYDDAVGAVISAADDVGKRYVDQQIYKALQTQDYRDILDKIGSMDSSIPNFTKSEISALLNPKQQKKLDNFLRRMKKLNVIRSGPNKGEYLFNLPMVRLYIFLKGVKTQK